MILTNEQLNDLIPKALLSINKQIKNANRTGNIEEYLLHIGLLDIIPEDNNDGYKTLSNGKIIIFGDSQVKEHEIIGCFKSFNIDKSRIEMHLSYEKQKNYQFVKLQYNPQYRLILFGPTPHSIKEKGKNTSIITNIEKQEGYPKVIRMTNEHGLKITKSNLKNVIKHEIDIGYL